MELLDLDEGDFFFMDESDSSVEEEIRSEPACKTKVVFGERSLSLKNLSDIQKNENPRKNETEIHFSSSGSEDIEENPDPGNSEVGQNQGPTRSVEEDFPGERILNGMAWKLQDYSIMEMPILENNCLVYLPGAVINETYVRTKEVVLMNNLMASTRLFGYTRSTRFSGVGTTCQLLQLNPGDPDGEIPAVGFMCTIRAKARQRFKILSSRRTEDRVKLVKALILPEISLPDPFYEVRLISRDRFRPIRMDDERKGDALTTKLKKYKFSKFNHLRTPVYGAPIMAFPNWVYEMYDPQILVERVHRKLLRFKLFSMARASIPDNPTELPFWVATYFPMDVSHKLALLKINCTIQRLRLVIRLLARVRTLCCHICGTTVGKTSHIFSTSREIPQGAGVRVEGYETDTITLLQARNIKRSALNSSEMSGYPGYKLRMLACENCNSFVGWKFTAKPDNNEGLHPRVFYGMSTDAVQAVLVVSDDEEEGWFTHVVA